MHVSNCSSACLRWSWTACLILGRPFTVLLTLGGPEPLVQSLLFPWPLFDSLLVVKAVTAASLWPLIVSAVVCPWLQLASGHIYSVPAALECPLGMAFNSAAAGQSSHCVHPNCGPLSLAMGQYCWLSSGEVFKTLRKCVFLLLHYDQTAENILSTRRVKFFTTLCGRTRRVFTTTLQPLFKLFFLSAFRSRSGENKRTIGRSKINS